MASGDAARIRALVAEQTARRGGPANVLDVCAAAVAALPVNGAGVSVLSRDMARHPLYGTDAVSERLEELQLTLGEGPCVDAYHDGSAVLTPDLRTADIRARWPMFSSAAVEAGAKAVFAFPLTAGAISSGVLDLYSTSPGGLDTEALSDALVFAWTATLVLLDTALTDLRPPGPPKAEGGRFEVPGGYRAEIDQATGMLTEQLGVGIEDAFIRLRAYAYACGRPLDEVAGDVVSRRLRFRPESDDPDTYPPPDRPGPGQDRS